MKKLGTFLLLMSLVLAACGGQEEPAPTAEAFPDFSWPPPRSSTRIRVPMSTLLNSEEVGQGSLQLRDLDHHLSEALEAAGYDEKAYHAVPGGFALVTRVEQIEPDGTPKRGNSRWSVEIAALETFSLDAYIRALFTAPQGFYRVIVFLITPYTFTHTEEIVPLDEADDWLRGADRLPQRVAEVEYSENFATTALIYVFEKPGREEKAVLKLEGIPTARQQLERANLWTSLR